MANEYVEALTRYLASKSITDFHFDYRRGKHPAVVIQHNGRSHRIVFPLTGSDWRGPANMISTVRHELGLIEPKAPQSSSIRRVRRHKAAGERARYVPRASAVESVAQRPDKFYGPLMVLKARLEAGESIKEPASPVTASSVETASVVEKPVRIALRTPWLGKQIRYATI